MSTRLTPAETEALRKRLSNETVLKRCANELRVLKMTCELAVKAGYEVSLSDGEEWTVKQSQDVSALVEAAQSTDMGILRIREKGDRSPLGDIVFIYGNSGSEVINDYTDNHLMRELLKPVEAYCETLSEKGE